MTSEPRTPVAKRRSYLSFEELPPNGIATRRWAVLSALVHGIAVGKVAWHAGFQRYAFYPEQDTCVDADGLRFLADFCATKTNEHKTS